MLALDLSLTPSSEFRVLEALSAPSLHFWSPQERTQSQLSCEPVASGLLDSSLQFIKEPAYILILDVGVLTGISDRMVYGQAWG